MNKHLHINLIYKYHNSMALITAKNWIKQIFV